MEQALLIRYQSILLETMRSFDAFCRRHGLRYSAAYGSAIGVVRHQGLIPWDDDMDVYMFREDYDRFLALMGSDPQVQGKYELVQPGTPYYVRSYAKFCDARTTLIEDERWPFVQGVFIDVFPLDHAPADHALVRRLQDRTSRRFGRYIRSVRRHPASEWKREKSFFGRIKLFFARVGDVLLWRPWRRCWLRQWERQVERNRHLEGPDWAPYTRHYGEFLEILPGAWFERIEDRPFADMQVQTLCGVDPYLRSFYGDYMTPPPPEKRISTHEVFYIDLDGRSRP